MPTAPVPSWIMVKLYPTGNPVGTVIVVVVPESINNTSPFILDSKVIPEADDVIPPTPRI